MSNILITGGAGFIGFHLYRYLQNKHQVTSMDLLQSNNLAGQLRKNLQPGILQGDIHGDFINDLQLKPEILIHLAAETGISGSMLNPEKYFQTNVNGTFNVLEQCRKKGVRYLIYASSSSVYSPSQIIMHEDGDTSHQLSFYGTSKKICEVMVENYCKQFGITAIGLRFFTVYGSFTRPDMAAYKFMKSIEAGQAVTLYNKGSVFRDFTHVSDIVKSIDRVIDSIVLQDIGSSRIFNIGYGAPISVKQYAEKIAENLGKKIIIQNSPLPDNELESTHSNTDKLKEFINYKPVCGIDEGIKEMTDWFKLQRYE